jgi:hypothetical protein
MSNVKTYPGFAYRQALDKTAPWIINFVATAEDLLSWVGIPRRTEKGLIGFQRLDEDKRVIRAKEFFSTPLNQSPTSLIIGIHEAAGPGDPPVKLNFFGPETDHIRKCEITVDLDSLALTDDQIRERIRNHIEARVKSDQESEDEISDESEESEDEEDDLEGEEVQDEIELGRSLLNEFLQMLSDETWFSENKDALVDYAKPATLIDGQHRIKGAELCERNIPFAVCALFNCSWAEQVFQFTVVNYTQKGIPDQFITANAALSLTGAELSELEERLVQAQVKVIEYELMRIVNFDQESAFHELVNLTTKPVSDKIGYKTMVRVAQQWYSGKNSAVQQLIANIYPEITGKKSEVKRLRLERWKNGDWGIFFKAFWREVKDRYSADASHEQGYCLWDVGHSNLMIAVVLLELQNAYLQNLGMQDEEYFQTKSGIPIEQLTAKVKDRAQKVLSYFPADVFAKPWGLKSLNTGAGRTALNSCFSNLVATKGSFKYANSALFTGKTDNT